MVISVIGLGLMGASLAGALKGFKGAAVIGADINESVCREAVARDLVESAGTEIGKAIAAADVVIFCIYARHLPQLIKENRGLFKSGAIAADICGVKEKLYADLKGLIPSGVEYIGLHPMTGKECDGIGNADPAIYKDSNFIICPLEDTKAETVEFMKELAAYIGVRRLAVSPVGKHDSVIGYTSSLMHIAATALCAEPHPETSPEFTAGAFRDCTRVADINAGAWTDLLMDNRDNTLEWLERYINNLNRFCGALRDKDTEKLFGLLNTGGGNKRRLLELWKQ